MTRFFIEEAQKGKPVYITDVRDAYTGLDKNNRQTMFCVLDLCRDNDTQLFEINVPILASLSEMEIEFVKSYVYAEIYNILSALGGRKMGIYVDESSKILANLARDLNGVFGIYKNKKERKGYGRCINVIDRMLNTLFPGVDGVPPKRFEFVVKDVKEMPAIAKKAGRVCNGLNIFHEVTKNLENKVICGMDIGGTDIKVAVSLNGRIGSLKEYDWFPAAFKLSYQQIEPICMLVRLVRADISLRADKSLVPETKAVLENKLLKAMHKEAPLELITRTVEDIEVALGHNIVEIDAIGLCFPDVVVKNKIVGGEVYKTRGMRNNPDINYEMEFSKLTHLNDTLLKLCRNGGTVRMTNDGPMASYTAAVEMTASKKTCGRVKNGIFAHTLGTELGTGWVGGNGDIPEIPLECYNFIIDLGSFVEKGYEPDDLRSINNFNTGLAGTLQKYCSQSGIFRLALKYFPEERPDLYNELIGKGFIEEKDAIGSSMLVVPTEPRDMRKPFLEHVMALPERENDETCKKIFREIGEYLAITYFETERILAPEAEFRVLFGRLVKNNYCFELMKEGARTRKKDIVLEVADGTMANTHLMKQLEEDPNFTVAQFAQAIGAIYYANGNDSKSCYCLRCV